MSINPKQHHDPKVNPGNIPVASSSKSIATTTAHLPSIFSLMLRTPYVPPSTDSTTRTSETVTSHDYSLDHFTGVPPDSKPSERGRYSTESEYGVTEPASLDDLLQTLDSLPTISADNVYFSPSSGWDSIKTRKGGGRWESTWRLTLNVYDDR
ncbi:hypothetical protein C8R42DRAFT_726667 [Lentinula raphanica]|nr:hypothetical protein C8R42DRAFT_726667 [Lentinula raphanica]